MVAKSCTGMLETCWMIIPLKRCPYFFGVGFDPWNGIFYRGYGGFLIWNLMVYFQAIWNVMVMQWWFHGDTMLIFLGILIGYWLPTWHDLGVIPGKGLAALLYGYWIGNMRFKPLHCLCHGLSKPKSFNENGHALGYRAPVYCNSILCGFSQTWADVNLANLWRSCLRQFIYRTNLELTWSPCQKHSFGFWYMKMSASIQYVCHQFPHLFFPYLKMTWTHFFRLISQDFPTSSHYSVRHTLRTLFGKQDFHILQLNVF